MAPERGRPAGQVRISVPRWAQAVFIPLAILLVVYFGHAVSHALLVFLLGTLVALLLNPLVAGMNRLKVPRGLGVAVVYVSFIAAIVVGLIILVPPLAAQIRRLVDNMPQIQETYRRTLENLQNWLASININVDVPAEVNAALAGVQKGWTTLAGALFTFGRGLLGGFATFIVIIFTSLYMLLDGRRIHRFLVGLVPTDEGTAERYLRGLQTSFTRYIRGQLLLGFTVGLACGLGVWILGWEVVGIWPEGSQYALLLGFWAGLTEVIPYIGPWLGAVPAVVLAFFHSPGTALWVGLVYFVVQELEGHILVPNIMGSSLGVHPLVVIFAILGGAQVAGIVGMLAVLPLLALVKWTFDFFQIRLSKSPWILDDGVAILGSPPEGTPGPGAPGAAVSIVEGSELLLESSSFGEDGEHPR